jgi:hypothetical protein
MFEHWDVERYKWRVLFIHSFICPVALQSYQYLKRNDSVRSATWRISQKLLIVVVDVYRIYDPKRLDDVIEAIFRSKSPVENEVISVISQPYFADFSQKCVLKAVSSKANGLRN